MNFFSGRPTSRPRRAASRGRTGERSRGGRFEGRARHEKEGANESVLGLEGASSRRARASRRLLGRRARRSRGSRPAPSFASVGVESVRIGTSEAFVLGVAAGTHELADATLVNRTGTATPRRRHAEVPRENRKPRSTTSRANPFASTNLFGIRRWACAGRPLRRERAGTGGGGRWGWGGDGRFGGRRGRAVRSRARPRGGRVGGRREDARERGGSSRARGEARDALSLARGRGARTRGGVTRRARGPRGTATRYRARARAVLQVETQSREKMEHLPICVSSVRTLSRASSGRGRHFGYCPSLFAFSASCDLLPRREQRPSPSPRVTPPRGGTRDPGPRPRASPRHGGEAPRPRRRRLPQDRGPRGVHARAAPRGGGVEGARGRVARLRRRPLPERRRVGGPRRRDRRERVRDAARVRRRARGPRPRAAAAPRPPTRPRAASSSRPTIPPPPTTTPSLGPARGPRPRRRRAPRRARDRRRGTPRSVRVRAHGRRGRVPARPRPLRPLRPSDPAAAAAADASDFVLPRSPSPSLARPRRRVRARPRAPSPRPSSPSPSRTPPCARPGSSSAAPRSAAGSADRSLDAFDGCGRRIRGGGRRRPGDPRKVRRRVRPRRRAPRRDGRGEGAGRRPSPRRPRGRTLERRRKRRTRRDSNPPPPDAARGRRRVGVGGARGVFSPANRRLGSESSGRRRFSGGASRALLPRALPVGVARGEGPPGDAAPARRVRVRGAPPRPRC